MSVTSTPESRGGVPRPSRAYKMSQKKCDLRLNAPRGLQKEATDKSWVSFEKFRKFPVQ